MVETSRCVQMSSPNVVLQKPLQVDKTILIKSLPLHQIGIKAKVDLEEGKVEVKRSKDASKRESSCQRGE